ncbi:MAG: NAD(P)/FAD-dependent oxidoreductase [bacterium]
MSKVIIIGSGMGGLVCGNLLAGKGHDVTIFEAHSAPGGYTAGFWRKGFYFESGTLSFENSVEINKTMADIGVHDKVEFTRQRIRWLSPEFDFVPDTIDDIYKNIMSAYPGENENLTRFFSEIDKMVKGLLALAKPTNFFTGIAYPFKLAKFMLVFKKYADVTLSEFSARYFKKDSKVYRLFKHMGYPEMSIVLLAGAFLTFANDYWTAKTGMQSWADALADNFKKLGGKLKLKSKVDRILTENNTAVGVDSVGEIIKADYVISASDYKKTFFRLLDDPAILPRDFKDRLEKAVVSEAFFSVYLGLDMGAEELNKYMKTFHIFYYAYHPDYDISDSNDESFFEKTSPAIYSPSLMNPELAPKGKSSLMIQSICPHQWMDNWGHGDKQIYRQLKELATRALIKKTTEIIPDLEKHIIFEDAATPLTYERFTHNTDGASSAWSWNPHKKFFKNPIAVKVGTPVRNLFISSCWASQFGGVPGAINAAYKCAKRIK